MVFHNESRSERPVDESLYTVEIDLSDDGDNDGMWIPTSNGKNLSGDEAHAHATTMRRRGYKARLVEQKEKAEPPVLDPINDHAWKMSVIGCFKNGLGMVLDRINDVERDVRTQDGRLRAVTEGLQGQIPPEPAEPEKPVETPRDRLRESIAQYLLTPADGDEYDFADAILAIFERHYWDEFNA